MKKLLLNSTILAGLVVGGVSLWMVANPIPAYAAGSSATCADGTTVSCSASGSNCVGVDSTASASGYCQCVSQADGHTTSFSGCFDGEPWLD